MSKIPEGATHTYTARGKTTYRRLNGNYWESYSDGDWIQVAAPHQGDYLKIQADLEWSGEGLPPVGFEGFSKSSRTQTFRACIVLALRRDMAVVCFPDHEEIQWATEFKTKSQVEDERARSLVCDRIYGIITGPGVERGGNTSDMAEALYDEGLRFVEVEK